jgi:hypothetical protein
MAAALECLNVAATTGRLDRAGLRALHQQVDRARRAGLAAQQISRLGSGRVRPQPQRRHLSQLLRDALAARAREFAKLGIEPRCEPAAADVTADPALLQALLQALLDWCTVHARSSLDFGIDADARADHTRLQCRVECAPVPSASEPPPPTDGIGWQLIVRLAQMLGTPVQRTDDAHAITLTLDFPRAVDSAGLALTLRETGSRSAAWSNSQPMAGRHVLVIAGRRETRNAVRSALRTMGLMLDFVGSVDEARTFCDSGLPHAVVYEAALAGDHFRRQREAWTAAAPRLVFVELAEHGRAVEPAGAGQSLRIGREVIEEALAPALVQELMLAA